MAGLRAEHLRDRPACSTGGLAARLPGAGAGARAELHGYSDLRNGATVRLQQNQDSPHYSVPSSR